MITLYYVLKLSGKVKPHIKVLQAFQMSLDGLKIDVNNKKFCKVVLNLH